MVELPARLGTFGVACRLCSRRTVYRALSAEAILPEADAVRRLTCAARGPRRPKVYRVTSEADAKRWCTER